MLALTGVAIIAFGACVYLASTYPYNSVLNDTGDIEAFCEVPRAALGPPDFVTLGPGDKAEAAGGGCHVYQIATKQYLGCLKLGKANSLTLFLSAYDSSIPSDKCRYGRGASQ